MLGEELTVLELCPAKRTGGDTYYKYRTLKHNQMLKWNNFDWTLISDLGLNTYHISLFETFTDEDEDASDREDSDGKWTLI